ncbi:hypothetical protein MKW94_026211, partial [Papaver nudicaule]|nr:hypothetical protein [Papaver nudicaule]
TKTKIQARRCPAPGVSLIVLQDQEDTRKTCDIRGRNLADLRLEEQISRKPLLQHTTPCMKDKAEAGENYGIGPAIIDIDSGHEDSLLCSLYSPDIKVMQFTRLRVSFRYTLHDSISIDRFLSQNFIEMRKLHLGSLACSLLHKEYDEISAPRFEEFCFIKDNRYSQAESSAPTVKTFFRRFLHAAHASDKALPLISTGYEALALQDLQLSTSSCPLNVIREKYKNQKYKSVATLSSPKTLHKLF